MNISVKKKVTTLSLFSGMLFAACLPGQNNQSNSDADTAAPTTAVQQPANNEAQSGTANTVEPQTTSADDGQAQNTSEKYMEYSDAAYAENADKKRVLFFHATWCPTCRAAEKDILSNSDLYPDDVVVFKVDYDTATELKQKYGVTYQHTFILVDSQGNQVNVWNGGGASEVEENTDENEL